MHASASLFSMLVVTVVFAKSIDEVGLAIETRNEDWVLQCLAIPGSIAAVRRRTSARWSPGVALTAIPAAVVTRPAAIVSRVFGGEIGGPA